MISNFRVTKQTNLIVGQ